MEGEGPARQGQPGRATHAVIFCAGPEGTPRPSPRAPPARAGRPRLPPPAPPLSGRAAPARGPASARGRAVNAPNRLAGRDKALRPRPEQAAPEAWASSPGRPPARSPRRGAGAAAATGPALGRGGRLPAGSPEAARAARSGAAARAPPPSASHPQALLGPGPARSLAAEPSASVPGGAYKAARQLRPGCHWPPSPRPRTHWLPLTAPPLPSAGPTNTARPAPCAPRLGGRRRRSRLATGRPARTRRRPPTCPLTGLVLIAGCARQTRGRDQQDGARPQIDKGASGTAQRPHGGKRILAYGVSPRRGLAGAGANHCPGPALVIRLQLST